MGYCPLHNHTHYSVRDSIVPPDDYLNRCQELGIKAFAVTDHGNTFAHPYFGKLQDQYPDIKILYGIEFYECDDITQRNKDRKYFHLIAIAKNENGRKGINYLVRQSEFDGKYYKPRIDLNLLKPYGQDLIITSACLASKLARTENKEQCITYIQEYKSVFPHFYLEIQSHDHNDQVQYNQKILHLSEITQTPYIITTDSHYLTQDDQKVHSTFVRLARDDDTLSEIYQGCYLQSEDEIFTSMSKYMTKEQIQIGLDNTNKIADLCENVKMPFRKPELPHFTIPEGFQSDYEYLVYQCKQGWRKRKLHTMSQDEQTVRKNRLKYELKVIQEMDFAGYFNIVAEVISWAKNNNIEVGDGRGSAASSIVNYLVDISQLDPITYQLPFERFLNKERISLPDIDTDFSDKEKIIQHLIDLYGNNHVSQIINYSYLTPQIAIQDVGRVLKIPYTVTQRIGKQCAFPTWDLAKDQVESILMQYPQYEEWIFIAGKLSGKIKTTSVHAGGVGITNQDTCESLSVIKGKNDETVISANKKIVESFGIVKFDFLGLKTLRIIQSIIQDANINRNRLDISNPQYLNDENVFQMICNLDTHGLFQISSTGMVDLIRRIQPRKLEELADVISLFRPDAIFMVNDYVSCKKDPSQIQYIHPDMKPILEPTYGCMIYQEQLMDIVRIFGNRTYGGADQFRKGIGSKDTALIQAETMKLESEIIANGYSQDIAKQICEHLVKLGNYMFNKSHGMSYALTAYKTAWLKYYYPLYFYKAYLNEDITDNTLVNQHVIQAQQNGITILPPSIHHSTNQFTIYNNAILFSLSAISGFSDKTVNKLLKIKKQKSFSSLTDFIERTNLNQAQMIALFKANVFSSKDPSKSLQRYLLSQYKPLIYKLTNTIPSKEKLQELGLNKATMSKEEILNRYNTIRKEEYTKKENKRKREYLKSISPILQNQDFWEYEALNIFLTHNPLLQAQDLLDQITQNQDIHIYAGIITKIQKKKSKKNNKPYATISLYTKNELVELLCFSTQLSEYDHLLVKHNMVVVLANSSDTSMIIQEVKSYEQWKEEILPQLQEKESK